MAEHYKWAFDVAVVIMVLVVGYLIVTNRKNLGATRYKGGSAHDQLEMVTRNPGKEYIGTVMSGPHEILGQWSGVVSFRVRVDGGCADIGIERESYWGQIGVREAELFGLTPGVRVRLVPADIRGDKGYRDYVHFVCPADIPKDVTLISKSDGSLSYERR